MWNFNTCCLSIGDRIFSQWLWRLWQCLEGIWLHRCTDRILDQTRKAGIKVSHECSWCMVSKGKIMPCFETLEEIILNNFFYIWRSWSSPKCRHRKIWEEIYNLISGPSKSQRVFLPFLSLVLFVYNKCDSSRCFASNRETVFHWTTITALDIIILGRYGLENNPLESFSNLFTWKPFLNIQLTSCMSA